MSSSSHSQTTTPPTYGGQAVIEGVMFTGKTMSVTAIRRQDESIHFFSMPRKQLKWGRKLSRIPFLRGIYALILSAVNGRYHMQFAIEQFEDAAAEHPSPTPSRTSSPLTFWLGLGTVAVLSLLFGKVLFTAIPAFLAGLFDPILYTVPQGTTFERTISNLLEGVIKIALLLTYLWLIARTPIIRRLFQYHGAEHKVINAYELGHPLTINHVMRASRFHYRCGSSFILFSAISGVLIYTVWNVFFPYSNLWERVVERILLLPLVIGLAYEILTFTNRWREHRYLKILGYPGLWLQTFTTAEPDEKQIEVALASFQHLLHLEATAKGYDDIDTEKKNQSSDAAQRAKKASETNDIPEAM